MFHFDEEDKVRKSTPYKRHGRQEKETTFRRRKKESFHVKRFWNKDDADSLLAELQELRYPCSVVEESPHYVVTWYGYSV